MKYAQAVEQQLNGQSSSLSVQLCEAGVVVEDGLDRAAGVGDSDSGVATVVDVEFQERAARSTMGNSCWGMYY